MAHLKGLRMLGPLLQTRLGSISHVGSWALSRTYWIRVSGEEGNLGGCIFTKLRGWLQCLLQFEDHCVTGSEGTVSVHPQGAPVQLHQRSLPWGPHHLGGAHRRGFCPGQRPGKASWRN